MKLNPPSKRTLNLFSLIFAIFLIIALTSLHFTLLFDQIISYPHSLLFSSCTWLTGRAFPRRFFSFTVLLNWTINVLASYIWSTVVVAYIRPFNVAHMVSFHAFQLIRRWYSFLSETISSWFNVLPGVYCASHVFLMLDDTFYPSFGPFDANDRNLKPRWLPQSVFHSASVRRLSLFESAKPLWKYMTLSISLILRI